jgi:structure-specific endonuclease subunit SLX1
MRTLIRDKLVDDSDIEDDEYRELNICCDDEETDFLFSIGTELCAHYPDYEISDIYLSVLFCYYSLNLLEQTTDPMGSSNYIREFSRNYKKVNALILEICAGDLPVSSSIRRSIFQMKSEDKPKKSQLATIYRKKMDAMEEAYLNKKKKKLSTTVAASEKEIKPSFVYLLVSTNNATYVGATVDLERRLRQHNKELVGGAHATGAKVANGEIWIRACHISGFPDWKAALQFEWRWKQLTRKLPTGWLPLKRRLVALKQLLGLERPTTKAVAYSEWSNGPPVVHIEIQDAEILYNE